MAASDIGIYGLLVAILAMVLTANVRVNGLAVRVAELRGDLTALRGRIDSLHGEMQAEFAKTRQELADRGTDWSAEISGIRERLARVESALQNFTG